VWWFVLVVWKIGKNRQRIGFSLDLNLPFSIRYMKPQASLSYLVQCTAWCAEAMVSMRRDCQQKKSAFGIGFDFARVSVPRPKAPSQTKVRQVNVRDRHPRELSGQTGEHDGDRASHSRRTRQATKRKFISFQALANCDSIATLVPKRTRFGSRPACLAPPTSTRTRALSPQMTCQCTNASITEG
jgi:hypothetical protein